MVSYLYAVPSSDHALHKKHKITWGLVFDPMTGEITKLAAFEQEHGKTKVAVKMSGEGAGFVVLRQPFTGGKTVSVASALKHQAVDFWLGEANEIKAKASQNGAFEVEFSDDTKQALNVATVAEKISISRDWKVTFSDIKSGPQTHTFPKLSDWTSHEKEEIKYYSGTATYHKQFTILKKQLNVSTSRILDLGEVHEVVRVVVNGQDLGVLWKSPFTVDITTALKPGKNVLKLEVTNQWTNRLIGDENFPNLTGYDVRPQLEKPEPARNPQMVLVKPYKMVDWYVNNEPAPLGKRSTFITFPFYEKGDPLIPAGLIGPVLLKSVEVVKIGSETD